VCRRVARASCCGVVSCVDSPASTSQCRMLSRLRASCCASRLCYRMSYHGGVRRSPAVWCTPVGCQAAAVLTPATCCAPVARVARRSISCPGCLCRALPASSHGQPCHDLFCGWLGYRDVEGVGIGRACRQNSKREKKKENMTRYRGQCRHISVAFP
jgi:hypothetical protein